jgi:ligand-binding sensor domain-containing protein
MLPDGDGNLWLGTTRGISRFDTAGGCFYNYDEGDGLLQLAFVTFACLRASDGRLYFGGVMGFNGF